MDFTFHNGTNGSSPWVEFYPYNPSLTAGYAFMAIFGIATVLHIILIFIYRSPYFIPFLLGGICETFAYYGRALSHPDRTAIGPWAQQQILLLVAPPLLSATIYMILSRIITALDAVHLSPMSPKKLTRIFVANDIVCFFTQLVGAGIQVTGDAKVMDIGLKAVLAGLVLGLVVFGVFVVLAVVFQRRYSSEYSSIERKWKRYMGALYVACAAMMIRNLVRVIEFGSPKGSAVRREEVYIYVFDGGMMMVVMLVLGVWHPGRLTRAKRAKGGEMHLLEDK